MLYFGGKSAIDYKYGLTGGGIYLFITYIRSMYKPMQDISKAMDSYTKADVGYERIQEVLSNRNEMCDAPGARDLPPIKGQISIEHVDFWYTEDQPVLKDVNISVEPGKTIALVGLMGAGKSNVGRRLALALNLPFRDADEEVERAAGRSVWPSTPSKAP